MGVFSVVCTYATFVTPPPPKEESNRNKKIKIMQEEEERRCSGLPPSTGRYGTKCNRFSV